MQVICIVTTSHSESNVINLGVITGHSNVHFSSCSPSGCTFWGKKPWSRKKKILWQLGTLVGAPVGIGLVAGIAVPAMIIGRHIT